MGVARMALGPGALHEEHDARTRRGNLERRAMRQGLVADWIRYHAENRKPSDPLFAACGELDDLIRCAPEEAWTATLELIALAADDRVLANVAAGPLEDLLTRSARFIDRAELRARAD